MRVLVDADALIKALNLAEWFNLADFNEAVYTVRKAQPVDAVPVRHGRWEWNGEAFICSACGNGHKGQPTIMGQPMFEFCPMCGADMRKDGEAHD